MTTARIVGLLWVAFILGVAPIQALAARKKIRQRRPVVARLLSGRPKAAAYPDFAALRKRIFGNKKVRPTGRLRQHG